MRLAAAASRTAAVSSRLEIYPRQMPSERALRLAHGAFVGLDELTETHLRERVLLRYPEAAPLPGRPALDELLAATGSHLTWVAEADDGRGAYRPRPSDVITLSSGSPLPTRRSTGDVLVPDASPEVALARQLEDRLQRAAREGAFLVLTVATRCLASAEQELARRFPVVVKSLETALIRAMREEAERSRADWRVVLQADAAPRDSADWQRLMIVVRRALDAVEREIEEKHRTVLLTRPGLLARDDRIDFLARLRERVGRRPEPGAPAVHGLWVLVPSEGSDGLPAIDRRAVPVIGPGEWARISEAWIENRHRAGPLSPGASEARA